MIAIHDPRKGFLASLCFVAGVAIYAAVSAGIVQATAFLPVFLGIALLERNRNK